MAILDLMDKTFVNDRVAIHHGDAFTYSWPTGVRWDIAWHDVWDELSVDNLSQSQVDKDAGDPDHSIARLMRRYARRVTWQGAWGHDFLRYQRNQQRNAEWRWR
jgi:hypothetical protein